MWLIEVFVNDFNFSPSACCSIQLCEFSLVPMLVSPIFHSTSKTLFHFSFTSCFHEIPLSLIFFVSLFSFLVFLIFLPLFSSLFFLTIIFCPKHATSSFLYFRSCLKKEEKKKKNFFLFFFFFLLQRALVRACLFVCVNTSFLCYAIVSKFRLALAPKSFFNTEHLLARA